jgi:hypothetical protein
LTSDGVRRKEGRDVSSSLTVLAAFPPKNHFARPTALEGREVHVSEDDGGALAAHAEDGVHGAMAARRASRPKDPPRLGCRAPRTYDSDGVPPHSFMTPDRIL